MEGGGAGVWNVAVGGGTLERFADGGGVGFAEASVFGFFEEGEVGGGEGEGGAFAFGFGEHEADVLEMLGKAGLGWGRQHGIEAKTNHGL